MLRASSVPSIEETPEPVESSSCSDPRGWRSSSSKGSICGNWNAFTSSREYNKGGGEKEKSENGIKGEGGELGGDTCEEM